MRLQKYINLIIKIYDIACKNGDSEMVIILTPMLNIIANNLNDMGIYRIARGFEWVFSKIEKTAHQIWINKGSPTNNNPEDDWNEAEEIVIKQHRGTIIDTLYNLGYLPK